MEIKATIYVLHVLQSYFLVEKNIVYKKKFAILALHLPLSSYFTGRHGKFIWKGEKGTKEEKVTIQKEADTTSFSLTARTIRINWMIQQLSSPNCLSVAVTCIRSMRQQERWGNKQRKDNRFSAVSTRYLSPFCPTWFFSDSLSPFPSFFLFFLSSFALFR